MYLTQLYKFILLGRKDVMICSIQDHGLVKKVISIQNYLILFCTFVFVFEIDEK